MRYLPIAPIGYVNGEPVYPVFGAAVNNVDAWIPEEWSGDVVSRIMRTSVVEAIARIENMSTDTKHVPRSAGMGINVIGKGSTYISDASLNDEVLLTARKLGRGLGLAEEDLADTAKIVNVINQKKLDWATSYARAFDNATLGVTGAESSTDTDNRPFTSVYKSVRTTQASIGYTADQNYTLGASANSLVYDALNGAFDKYESGDYFEEGETVVLAHPYFRRALRGVKDNNGTPVFVRGQSGDSGTPDTLWGYPAKWSQGCKTSPLMQYSPTGNPLLIVAHQRFLIVGRRSGPESIPIPANISREDEAFLKMRSRRGFAVGHPQAFSVYEAATLL